MQRGRADAPSRPCATVQAIYASAVPCAPCWNLPEHLSLCVFCST